MFFRRIKEDDSFFIKRGVGVYSEEGMPYDFYLDKREGKTLSDMEKKKWWKFWK